ncbi:MAG: hypothetical protein WC548_03060 [Candidatus Pacearchaeota archaeon]
MGERDAYLGGRREVVGFKDINSLDKKDDRLQNYLGATRLLDGTFLFYEYSMDRTEGLSAMVTRTNPDSRMSESIILDLGGEPGDDYIIETLNDNFMVGER